MGRKRVEVGVGSGLGALGVALIGLGLWGLERYGNAVDQVVCSETHCASLAGIYQAALIVGVLLLTVVSVALTRRAWIGWRVRHNSDGFKSRMDPLLPRIRT